MNMEERTFFISISEYRYEDKVNLLEGTIDGMETQAIFDQFTEEEMLGYMEEIRTRKRVFGKSKTYECLEDAPPTIDCTVEKYIQRRTDCMLWKDARDELMKIIRS